jgi:hypothetical protein
MKTSIHSLIIFTVASYIAILYLSLTYRVSSQLATTDGFTLVFPSMQQFIVHDRLLIIVTLSIGFTGTIIAELTLIACKQCIGGYDIQRINPEANIIVLDGYYIPARLFKKPEAILHVLQSETVGDTTNHYSFRVYGYKPGDKLPTNWRVATALVL